MASRREEGSDADPTCKRKVTKRETVLIRANREIASSITRTRDYKSRPFFAPCDIDTVSCGARYFRVDKTLLFVFMAGGVMSRDTASIRDRVLRAPRHFPSSCGRSNMLLPVQSVTSLMLLPLEWLPVLSPWLNAPRGGELMRMHAPQAT